MAEDLAGLLRWYAEMGVDIAVDSTPHDRFAEFLAHESLASKSLTAKSSQAQTKLPAPAPPQAVPAARRAVRDATPTISPGLIVASARDSAAAAANLEDLRERLAGFDGCGLKATATRLVFGDGNPGADIMFIGEAPGAEEDRQGVPFAGRAGQLLDKMLASIGLERGQIYIANTVPWRPPGNRAPAPHETAACLPFTRRQIELVDPKILVCLGAAAAQTLLGVTEGILRLRGRWFACPAGDREIRTIAMLHPAYLLRQPAQKKLAWQDLRMLVREIHRLQLFPEH